MKQKSNEPHVLILVCVVAAALLVGGYLVLNHDGDTNGGEAENLVEELEPDVSKVGRQAQSEAHAELRVDHAFPLELVVEALQESSETAVRMRSKATVTIRRILGKIQSSKGSALTGRIYLLGRLQRKMTVLDACTFRSGQSFKLEHVVGNETQIWAKVEEHRYAQLLKDGIRVKGASLDVGELTVSSGRTLLGMVVGPGGVELANAAVTLVQMQRWGSEEPRALLQDGPKSVESDRKGRFQIEEVPPGSYVLVARKAGYPSGTSLFRVIQDARWSGKVKVRVRNGVMLRGQILGHDTKGIGGARVLWEEYADAPGRMATTSDSSGQFELHASNQVSSLKILRDGFLPRLIRGVRATPRRQVFRLAEAFALRGRLSATAGNLDSISTIRLTSVDGIQGFKSIDQETDDEGQFEFKGLPEGRYAVTGINGKFGVCHGRVDIPTDKALQLWLPKQVPITFEAVDDTGIVIGAAKIEITQMKPWQGDVARQEVIQAQLDARGQFRFHAMSGTILFWKVSDPATQTSQTGSLRTTEPIFQRIRFSNHGVLVGSLDLGKEGEFDPRARPVLQLVEIEKSSARISVNCVAREDGTFVFQSNHVPRGRYRLQLLESSEPAGDPRVLAEASGSISILAEKTLRVRCLVRRK